MLFAFLVSEDPGDMVWELAVVAVIHLLEEWLSQKTGSHKTTTVLLGSQR